MATLSGSTTFGTEFTPAAGDFIASATDRATLMRKNNSGAAWCVAGRLKNEAVIVKNPVDTAVYKWEQGDGTCAVSADQ